MTRKAHRFEILQTGTLLALAGLMLFFGVISFVNHLRWQEPTDHVQWERRGARLVAASVQAEGAGARAGIREGDRLVGIDGVDVNDPELVEVLLFTRDIGERAEYTVSRAGREETLPLTIGGVPRQERTYYYLAFVGLAFLVVGVFALVRRQAGPTQRFFFLALAFYMLFALSPTSRDSDSWHTTIYWLDQLARDLTPAVFLWFALTFPRAKKEVADSRPQLLTAVFAPAVALLALNAIALYGSSVFGLGLGTASRLFALASRAELVYFAGCITLGVLAFAHTYKTLEAPTERMRLKWLLGGVALGLGPFLMLYVPLRVLEIQSVVLTNVAVLPLILVPLSFAYAAVGFRLWDVEVLLKRGLIYAVSLLAILGAYLGVQWTLTRVLGPGDELVQTASVLGALLVAVAFAPLRDRLQDFADRMYYRDRYRARRTLMEFGRELNSETDVGRILDLLVQRVRDTLNVGRVGLLLRVEERDPLRIVPHTGSLTDGQPLSSNFSQFVAGALVKREFLFVDDLQALLEEFPEDRELLEAEDLAYFLPLEVKGDIIGVLALGRKISGDYLSTEDLDVLRPLAAHVALAIDNALLYREVQRRALELERLKSYSENIVDSMRGGLMVLDDQGRVLSWNRAMEQIHGREAADANGRRIDELFPAAFIRVVNEASERVAAGLEPVTSAYRIPLRTHAGRDRVVTLSLAPLIGEEGGQGTVIIVDDVTERTELESQLRQAEKLTSVGLLAAGVAHEVNTPLTGISSYVQMLQRKLPETDPRRAVLEKIEKQAFRASAIVNNLLNFSRQETGEFRSIHVNDVVDETLSLADVQLRKRNVAVRVDKGEEMSPVHGDPIKLQQVLMNLVLNARDAMPQGGELSISTRQEAGDVVIAVSDTGTGIAHENLSKVYDPFFTTKGVGKGTGLGLSVSYGIIQEHRGTMAVDSSPGEGTTFRISIPAIESDATRAAAS